VSNTLEIVIKGTDQASGAFDRIEGRARTFGSGLQSAMRGAVIGGGLVAGAIVGIGLAASRVFGPTIDLAREFESAVVDMGIASANAGLSLDTLEDAAIAVGGDTKLLGVTASSGAEAITALFKAGLTSTEVFGDLNGYLAGTAELGGALRASIDLAAATELDMVQSSELAAIALSTFGGELETEEERAAFVEAAMNNMVQTANASVSSVTDLAASMTTAGPVFSMFGYDLEDTNNALAVLSTRGIAGAEAGTALKSMLLNMTAQTASTQDAWAALGLSMYDSEGNMRELPDVIGDLNAAMADMTEEERNATMTALAGSYGIKALSTLLAEGEQGWYDMADATAEAMGITEQAALKAQTLAGQQEILAGVMETLKIQIGQALTPALTTLTGAFAGLAEKYGPQVVAMMATLGAWLAANLPGMIDGAIAALQNLVTGLQPVVAWVMAFVTEHGPALKEAFLGIAAVLGAFVAAGSIAAIGLAIAALANPISLIAAGIALLAVAWTRDWGGIRTTLLPILETVGTALQANLLPILAGLAAMLLAVVVPAFITWAGAAWTAAVATVTALAPVIAPILAIGAAVGLLVAAWTNDWGGIRTKLTAFWEETGRPIFETVKAWLVENIPAALAVARDWFVTAWANIQATVQTVWTALQGVWATLVNVFTVTIPAAIASVRDWFFTAWANIQATVEAVWARLTAIWDAVATVFTVTIPAAALALQQGIQSVLTAVGKAFTAAWNAIVWFLRAAWDTIRIVILTAIILVLKILGTNLDEVRALWERVWNAVSTFATTVWNAISTTVETVFNAVVTFIETTLAAFSANWGIAWNYVSGIATTAWNAIKTTVETVFNAVKGFVETTLATFKANWETSWNLVSGIATRVWDAIYTKVSAVAESIRTYVETKVNALKTQWETAWNLVKTAAETVWNAIKTKIEEILPAILLSVQTKALEVKAALIDPIIAAKDAIFAKVGEWAQLGRDLLDGLVDGVKERVGNLIDSVTGAVGDAIQEAKNLLGIHSPSKVFEDIGRNLMAGFTVGIDATAQMPAMAVASAAGGAVAAARSVSTVSTTNHYYLSPTYGYQDERTIAQDVRLLSMLAGG
jgi:TP901 family phage tail tape measure protein